MAIGYYLRKAREAELYKDGGYASIHEMASSEFGMARQTAEHCMRINEKFSEGGDSPALEEAFRKYGKSQLQEMLYLTDEQLEDVRPEMTVKDIRNIRKPVEEPMEAPEPKPELRQGRKPTEEEREILDELARKLIRTYEDWMLNDFQARVSNVRKSYRALWKMLGDRRCIWFSGKNGTYQAELFEDYVQLREEHDGCLGNIEPSYLANAIQGMWNEVAFEDIRAEIQQARVESDECSTSSKEPEEEPAEENQEEEPEEELSDLNILKDKLEREKRLLGIALKTIGAEDRHTRQQKLVVSALAAAVCDLENAETPAEEPVQPELPILKNNEQRKEWLRNYKEWGLWYEDKHIGAKYYKYDFQNGACLIAETYEQNICGRMHESSYLHLIGAPKDTVGANKWTVHEQYNRFPNSETELVEFLKELQR